MTMNTQENWKKALEAALQATDLAEEVLLKYWGELKHVSEKLHAGLVSEADKESERMIQKHLQKAFPDIGFLGEEMSFENQSQFPGGKLALPPKGSFWIVDPLDGTTNYVHQFPIFCSSIGLMVDGEVKVGVIRAPILKETFTAIKGGGAYLGDRKLQVSQTKELKDSLLATGFFADNEPCLNEQLQIFSDLIRNTRGVRRPGAAAYDLCMVAKGVFDCFWERNLNSWDTAAGILLVQEAGGSTKSYQGKDYHPFMNSLVAGNPYLTPQVLQLVQKNISTDAD